MSITVQHASAPASPVAGPDLALLTGPATRLVLSGHPRPGAAAARQDVQALRPKELMLALAAAVAEADGLQVQRANPHFTPLAEWDAGLAVAHFCGVDVCCPLPVARNALVLDGEDLLALAEEQRAEDAFGLHRRRVGLMDAVLSVAPPGVVAAPLLGREAAALPVAALLARGAPLVEDGGRRRAGAGPLLAGPVQWLGCDLETGHYNYLELKRRPRLRTSHARVLLDPGLRGGAAALIAFATPGTLAELGPALRAFAALRSGATEGEAASLFFVFFFGSHDEFATALAARPDALFFGDNFRCPAIRFLFAPFAPADVLAAVRGAGAVVDSCYGGALDALARGMGVGNRILLGPGGTVEAHRDAGRLVGDIAWPEVLAPGTLASRRQKINRAGERRLAEVLEAVI